MLRNNSSSYYKYINIDDQNNYTSFYLTFKSPIRRERTQSNEKKDKNDSFIINNPKRINLTKRHFIRNSYSSKICPKNLFYDSLCEKCFNSKQGNFR